MQHYPDLARLPDWEARLRAYLEQVQQSEFRWGEHDCALFAADCVREMCGVDFGAPFRGQYTTEQGARLALRKHGAGTLLRTFRAALGSPKMVSLAQRGDIILRDAFSAGLCVGQFTYFVGVAEGLPGLVPVPTGQCRYAFTVPFAPKGEA